MDRYLVDPLARWIVYSTGWSPARSRAIARTVVVLVVVVSATGLYWLVNPI